MPAKGLPCLSTLKSPHFSLANIPADKSHEIGIGMPHWSEKKLNTEEIKPRGNLAFKMRAVLSGPEKL